ncbi:MAG TPA: hypothetical protein VMK65_02365 [Longimicrobiales bacterium]|nr:hypothetical protein [Longimicrobiales bacterium]
MRFFRPEPRRGRVPTVLVRLVTDEGEVVFHARWKRRPIDLQRLILYRLREGKALWFEDDRGRDLCFKPETISAAVVDGRPASFRVS